MPLQFTQSCPTCGRRLEVPARLYGESVVCQHCSCEFRAGSRDAAGGTPQSLLARVEAALNRSDAVPPLMMHQSDR